MGAGQLQVVVDRLLAAASRWRGLSAQLNPSLPSPGQPFQPTTAAVNGVNTAIGVAAGALMARTQATAAGVAAAAGGYSEQEVTAVGEMAAVTQVRVV